MTAGCGGDVEALCIELSACIEIVLHRIRSFDRCGPSIRGRKPPGQANGVIAQLVERVNGIHEVSGSIPLGSTK